MPEIMEKIPVAEYQMPSRLAISLFLYHCEVTMTAREKNVSFENASQEESAKRTEARADGRLENAEEDALYDETFVVLADDGEDDGDCEERRW